jgi:hypothetical protein
VANDKNSNNILEFKEFFGLMKAMGMYFAETTGSPAPTDE